MRAVFAVLFLAISFIIAGCSKEESDDRTLEHFISSYVNEGVEVDPDEKPLFQMIGAVDGVIFYMDQSPVKIYEFSSVSALNKAIKDTAIMSDWPTNGKFALETNHEEAKSIFNNL